MRLVAAEYLSLDGVTEDPGPVGDYQHRGWTVPYWDADIAKVANRSVLCQRRASPRPEHLRGVRCFL